MKLAATSWSAPCGRLEPIKLARRADKSSPANHLSALFTGAAGGHFRQMLAPPNAANNGPGPGGPFLGRPPVPPHPDRGRGLEAPLNGHPREAPSSARSVSQSSAPGPVADIGLGSLAPR